MLKRCLLLTLFALAPTWLFAQVLDTATITAASTSCLATNCVSRALSGIDTVSIGVAGTFVGTLQVEISNDREVTWEAWTVLQQSDRTLDTSITTTGLWLGGNAGYTHMRVRASAWTSGSAAITLTRGLGGVSVPLTSSAGGDGAIQDGASAAIEATVRDYVNSNPIAVTLTDANGDYTAAGGGTQYAVDGALGSTPTGTLGLAIRDDALSTLTPVEGDAVGLRVDSTGALWVSTGAAQPLLDDPIFADDAAFTLASSKVTMAGAIRDDALGALAAAETDAVPLRVDATGALWVSSIYESLIYTQLASSGIVIATLPTITPGTGVSNLGKAAGNVAGGNETGVFSLAIRDDALTTLGDDDGDYTGVRTTSTGALWVASASLVPGTAATNLGKAVDSVAGATDTGVAILAIRDDALTTLTPADGDYVPLRVSSTGALHVIANEVQPLLDDFIFADDAAFTLASSKVGVSGAIRDDALATLAAVEGDVVPFRVNASGALYVTGSAGVSEFNEDTAHGTGAAGNLGLAVRNDAGTALADDGDYIPLQVNGSGALYVTGGGGGTEYVVNAVAPTNPTGTTFVMERDDALSALAEIEGDWTNGRSNANGALWVTVDGTITAVTTVTTVSSVTNVATIGTSVTPGTAAANLGKAVDNVAGATDTGVLLLAVRDDTLASLTPVDGDYTQLRVNSQGALHVTGAAGTQYAEDIGHSSGDAMVFVAAVRRDTTPTSSAGAAGDYTAFNTDANGRLYTNTTIYNSSGTELTVATDQTLDAALGTTGPLVVGRGSTATPTAMSTDNDATALWLDLNGRVHLATEGVEDVAETAAAFLARVGTVRRDAAASSATTDGDNATLNTDASGRLWVNCGTGCSGGTQFAEDLAAISADVGTIALAVRRDAAASSSTTDGDYSTLNTDSTGRLWVTSTQIEDVAETAAGELSMAGSVRRDVAASSAGTTGDNATLNTSALGALWVATVDPCSSGTRLFVALNQTTGTQLFTGTASNRTYVCHMNLVTATAQNVALVSGTGTVCATSLGPMMGGTTAATGWNFAANGGIVVGGGDASVAKSDTDADNICLLTSSSGQISGVIAYVVAPN